MLFKSRVVAVVNGKTGCFQVSHYIWYASVEKGDTRISSGLLVQRCHSFQHLAGKTGKVGPRKAIGAVGNC